MGHFVASCKETAPLSGLPDKHDISFVLSDLPISFIVVRKLESRQFAREREREKKKRQDLQRIEVNDGVTREARQRRESSCSDKHERTLAQNLIECHI